MGLALPSVRLGVTDVVVPDRPRSSYRVVPEEVLQPGFGVVAVASGGYHQLAVTAGGEVLAWGSNQYGQLGNGTRADRTAAVLVSGLSEVKALAAGAGHSLALRVDGSVWAWGGNGVGALGDGTKTDRHLPVQVKGLECGVRAIAAAHGVSYAITDDGAVLGWGQNAGELLGIDDSPHSPAPVPGIDGEFVALAAGINHRLALRADGSLVVWGWELFDDAYGFTETWAPREVDTSGRSIVMIAAGAYHSLALTAEGELLSWGQNSAGELGDRATSETRVPHPAAAVEGEVAAIAGGFGSSLALMRDGTVLSWGWNHQGQLGNGSEDQRTRPAPVVGLERVVAIAPWTALTEDGAVYWWGGELPRSEPGPQADLPVGTSKLGGSPDLPAKTPWPDRDGRPMAFVAQLDLAAVAPLAPDGQLPQAGLLSFFCSTIDFGDDHAGLVIHTPADQPLQPRDPPPELPSQERFAAARLEPQPELTGIPYQSQTLERLGLSWEQRLAYCELLGQEDETPVHRLLGHPELVQSDPRDQWDRKLRLLLQIDSEDQIGMM